jgi:pimeloyl-ACP methyl ester carboxylesterase
MSHTDIDDTLVSYHTEKVGDLSIFYRESGDPSKPTVVLLHGFPASSHQYRDVLRSALAKDYHLIAPDYPGFGDSSFPSATAFSYTFDQIAEVMDRFLEQRAITHYTLMMQDYGAPIGFRIATKHPERVTGLIIQNANAYEEGISPKGWGPVLDYWKHKTPELEKTIEENVFSLEAIKWQYTHGTRQPDAILPENWNLDFMKLSRPGQHRVQLDLFYDYQNNLKLYPVWQEYLRQNQPPILIVWGKNDAFFPEIGAQAYKRDVKNIDYYLLDTGHFALEEDGPFIIKKMKAFLNREVQK